MRATSPAILAARGVSRATLGVPSIVVAALLLLASCGSSAPRIVVRPMTDAEGVVFENGIDYIDDPTLLEGSWLETWEGEIDPRVRRADVVAYVRITTMRTDTDLERRETHRLVAHIDSLRHGEPGVEDLELVVREGDPGFGTVHDQERRILNQRFAAFVRWEQTTEGGPVVARWHLAPASERIVRRVNSLIEAQRAPDEDRRRIIIHDQESDDEN